MSKGGFGRGAWCVVGDFNAVLHREERRGVNNNFFITNPLELSEFQAFVNSMELEDIPVLGRKFTWFHPNGSAMSRIDRVLLSDEWLSLWGNPSLWILPREVSDHCPLVLRYNCVDWGPRPFRFKNHWLLHGDFKNVVEASWRSNSLSGWMGFILKEKLKGLKVALKAWNKQVYGVIDTKIRLLVEDINEIDVKGELVALSEVEVGMRRKNFEELWHLLKSKESLIVQRSRARWLKEGDANTSYFHKCLRARGSSNSIKALQVGGVWVESPEEIRQATVDFFKHHFCLPLRLRPFLDGVEFPLLSEAANLSLTLPFALEEIEVVVAESDGNKSPGPDGFNFNFVKQFWHLLKNEVRILFDQFHGIGNLPKNFMSYFIALIPKVSSPLSLGDFRPISLLGCLYKLVAKVLAKRLAKVMDPLVATTQSAFLKGRYLVDGVMVVNEVVDMAKKSGKNCLILKVDFEKAYDSVDWSFLDYMLGRFGFCDQWRKWIRTCVFSGSMSILVNGSPTEEINIQRGLKQGDPLAPFLFLLVAEGLGGLLRKAVELNRFKGFRVGRRGVVISHLQYADDTLCIGEATLENLWALKAILRGFEMVSGLKVNFWKSNILGVNVSHQFMSAASVFLNCRIGSIPFKYLGLPVGANIRREATWEPLLNSLRNRLGCWENRFISLGGRITLLNSVLNSIPIFYLSFLKIPILVWKKIRRIQREFLWGGRGGRKKINWIKWDVVCQPKSLGGLGVRDIRAVNISLLVKWRWRLLEDDHVLWKEVLKGKYGEGVIGRVELGDESKPWYSSTWWKDICSIGINLDQNWFSHQVIKKLGDGSHTSFWKDAWVGDVLLCVKFPRLFSIVSNKEATVAELWSPGVGSGWNLSWRRNLFVWETTLLEELMVLLGPIVLSTERDDWGWRPEQGGGFTVNSTYSLVVNLLIERRTVTLAQELAFKAIWKCSAPSKVAGLIWMILHDKAPTRDNLIRRQIISENGGQQGCVFCGNQFETAQHLFLYCPVTMQIWERVFAWLNLHFLLPHNILSLLIYVATTPGTKYLRRGLVMIWCAVIWSVWRHRNRIVFENGVLDGVELLDDIKVASWKWWIGRGSSSPPCLFYEWKAEPVLCIKNN
ncbi:hypothetical protein P8452_51532 [Trifolium repens]|nr:hypothetical protein P8452_51532 [Trifolium repens]